MTEQSDKSVTEGEVDPGKGLRAGPSDDPPEGPLVPVAQDISAS